MNTSATPNKKCAMSTQLLSGPIIDKFFATGAIACSIGGAALGASLWAMLHGALPISNIFVQLRSLHVIIEFYLFCGLFIIGFLLHMGPRIMQTGRNSGPPYLLILPTLLLGCAFLIISPNPLWGRLFLSLPFVVLFGQFFQDLRIAPADIRRMFGPWLMTSLFTFSLAAWFPLNNPTTALGIVWLSIAAITFAAGRAFIIGALGGRRMTSAENATLFVIFCAAGACLVWQSWHLGGLLAAICFGYYVYTTHCLVGPRQFRERNNNAPILNVAFTLGYFWALVGTVYLALVDEAAVDGTIHLLALGWISTLIIGISSQMTRALTGTMPLSEKGIIGLICLWQVTPVIRGFGHLIPTGTIGAFLLMATTWSVLLCWSGALLMAVVRLWLKMRKRPGKLHPFVTSA